MTQLKAADITWHEGTVTRAERTSLLGQKGCTVWFTGLSACGKSTVAVALEQVLIRRGHAAYVLDGDNIRHGLNAGAKILIDSRGTAEPAARRFGLGFSAEDREENIRRIGEVARLFADAGMIAITSFISPYRKDRDAARKVHEKNKGGPIPFLECWVNTPIEICEQRDPKGLYKQAREALAAGKGMGFTGVDDPYEPPEKPELVLEAGARSVQQCVADVLEMLEKRGILSA
jgi:adenylylsulfate kinase